MLRVKLSCGHSFETGKLSEAEEKTKSTICPKCFKLTRIVEVVRLKHPPNWVEGKKVL